MNFADIEIPFLLGGATPGEQEQQTQEQEQGYSTTPEKNTIDIQKLSNSYLSDYFIKNSSIFLIMIVACVFMFIIFMVNNSDFTKLIKNGTVTVLFFGLLSVFTTCGVLLFFGFGSNKEIGT